MRKKKSLEALRREVIKTLSEPGTPTIPRDGKTEDYIQKLLIGMSPGGAFRRLGRRASDPVEREGTKEGSTK